MCRIKLAQKISKRLSKLKFWQFKKRKVLNNCLIALYFGITKRYKREDEILNNYLINIK